MKLRKREKIESEAVESEDKDMIENEIETGKLSQSIRIFRNIIITLLVVVMLVSAYLFYQTGRDVTDGMMARGQYFYGNQFNEWEIEQQTILKMLSSFVSVNPEIMDDYDEAVLWLDNISRDYPSISVCYLANPDREHTIIMNNGWQPEPGWKVEDRDWYKSTMNSKDGFSISEPYYDEQTGNYCITMSEKVYSQSGDFIGVFAIDLYMDKIISIFGESYSEQEYVFLVDPNGNIINHPNPQYQITKSSMTNIAGTPYSDAFNSDEYEMYKLRDYDGKLKCCKCKLDKTTGFYIVLVWNYWDIYIFQIVYTVLYVVLIVAIIVAVIMLINKVIRSQAKMNERLSEAARAATVAGKAKSDFLAQMSHEIRTPINAVIGMDEMILNETEDPDIKEYARDIKSASHTLLTIINGILDFSKIESGKMEIIPVKYESAKMITDLVNMIDDRAVKKGLEFKLDIDPNIPKTLYGDDVRIKQVIVNLLTNAVKYTEKGTVTLTMREEARRNNESELFVEVRDTGIGIKEEEMDKLFQSFQRLDEKKNRNIEGTGLGMSIVDGILRLMNSSLSVESKYGEGSAFSFRFIQKVEDDSPMGEFHKHMALGGDEISKRQLKILKADILVVDDNEMNLKVAKGLMKRIDVVPELASSGRDSIEMLKHNHYDIILMDHMMPDLDGIETLRIIREKKLIGEDTAVIALTANAIQGAREMYISEGFKDYLSKPIDPAEFENILVKYLPKDSFTYEDRSGSVNETDEAEELKEEKEESRNSEVLEKLREDGFNVDAALGYCMDDEDFYIELLKTFANSAPEKREAITAFYSEENWKDYQVQVHALKSSSRTIGLDTLSDMALDQENAAGENDEKTIFSGYGDMMSEYDESVRKIKSILNIDASPVYDEPDDDMEILEFMPE